MVHYKHVSLDLKLDSVTFTVFVYPLRLEAVQAKDIMCGLLPREQALQAWTRNPAAVWGPEPWCTTCPRQ